MSAFQSRTSSPPLEARSPLSPRRRHPSGGSQPPALLTTALINVQNHGLGNGSINQTPHSVTSLSTPFATQHSSPFPASPGGALRGTSPMDVRQAAVTSNMPYNPQQWEPLSAVSPSVASSAFSRPQQTSQSARVATFAPRLVGPDEPFASPPPPYSPQRVEEQQTSPLDLSAVLSPSDTVSPSSNPSNYNTPISAASTISQYPSSKHNERLQYHDQNEHTLATGHNFPPPPPPAVSGRVRSSSKDQAQRLLSSIKSRGKSSDTHGSFSAVNITQGYTAVAFAHVPATLNDVTPSHPPAARRAASTGAIGLGGSSSRSVNESPRPAGTEHGMPVPPPPPGPPPAGARSQSLNRPSMLSSSGTSQPSQTRLRRPPGNGTSLGPVPPTPADWREENVSTVSENRSNPSFSSFPLHVNTENLVRRDQTAPEDFSLRDSTAVGSSQPSHFRRESSGGLLLRSPAVRNRSAKGIRERRSESRNGKERNIEESNYTSIPDVPVDSPNVIKPIDLAIPLAGGGLSRRRISAKSGPKYRHSMRGMDDVLDSANSDSAINQILPFNVSSSQLYSPRPRNLENPSNFTPPFSPGRDHGARKDDASPAILPNSLPTPPPQTLVEPQLSLVLEVPSPNSGRPGSHLLHIPDGKQSVQVPLAPSSKTRKSISEDLLGPESHDLFSMRAIERHNIFAQREACAANDSERLDIFMQFMTAESRIRRERYAATFGQESIDIEELTQGLFALPRRQQKHDQELRCNASEDGIRMWQRDRSTTPVRGSQTSRGLSIRVKAPDSPVSVDSNPQARQESSWWNDYVPCLSPIASMSIGTGQDELGSRGRAPSRWWESNSGGSANGDAFKVLQRSKRESKYMGLPLEIHASPEMIVDEMYNSASQAKGWTSTSEQKPPYGSDEYPREKNGWNESTMVPPPPSHPPTPQSAPYTPDPRKLDISRLVTLPPPYPRRHPALNNSHPDLADIRSAVRSLGDFSEAKTTKETHQSQLLEKRQRADSWSKHQRLLHTHDIQYRIEHGEIDQEEYVRAEKAMIAKEAEADKGVAQADFDLYQNVVVSPLHALFTERIATATVTIDKLSTRLFSDAQSHSPNLPQEEGDEQSELLEKLTQLKWLFEAREALHRETYTLLSERNERYKTIVLLPYKQESKHAKKAEAESFFARDTRDRQLVFDREILARSEAFLAIIESNVVRGVEVQLSAFWDIAPSLLKLLQRIPRDLQGFEIQIPPAEYEENPSYYEHPMQYLYSLLEHAEKSSYQFIESQVNLLCLLHEVKNFCLTAKGKVEGAGFERTRQEEETRLTADLKEKVGVVEGLWGEALGKEITEVKETVRAWLEERDGWTEDGDE